jgi:hypothetical protein
MCGKAQPFRQTANRRGCASNWRRSRNKRENSTKGTAFPHIGGQSPFKKCRCAVLVGFDKFPHIGGRTPFKKWSEGNSFKMQPEGSSFKNQKFGE